MIIVMGTAKFPPGEMDRLMPQLQAHVTATVAEDGCGLYAFSRDINDPDLLHISERWRDQAAIDAHSKAAHMPGFGAALRAANLQGLSIKAWNAEGERLLMGS